MGAFIGVSVGVLRTRERRAAERRRLVRRALPDAACLQSAASWKHLPAVAVRHFPHAHPRTHSASILSSKSASRAGKWSREHGWDECPTTGSLATHDRGAQHGKGGRVQRDHCRADRNTSEPDAAPYPVGRHAASVERGNPHGLCGPPLSPAQGPRADGVLNERLAVGGGCTGSAALTGLMGTSPTDSVMPQAARWTARRSRRTTARRSARLDRDGTVMRGSVAWIAFGEIGATSGRTQHGAALLRSNQWGINRDRQRLDGRVTVVRPNRSYTIAQFTLLDAKFQDGRAIE